VKEETASVPSPLFCTSFFRFALLPLPPPIGYDLFRWLFWLKESRQISFTLPPFPSKEGVAFPSRLLCLLTCGAAVTAGQNGLEVFLGSFRRARWLFLSLGGHDGRSIELSVFSSWNLSGPGPSVSPSPHTPRIEARRMEMSTVFPVDLVHVPV